MILMRTIAIAAISRTWIYPPKVVAVTRPKAHKTSKIIAMVVNMAVFSFWFDRPQLSGGGGGQPIAKSHKGPALHSER
jgi:hypothetical protein